MRDFRKLDIWKDSLDIVTSTYKMTALFPMEERFGLKIQMGRAAVSISSNIAEGCSRHSERDFKRFLEISQGSAFELETQMIIASHLGYISEERLMKEVGPLNFLQKRINGLIERIKRDIARGL